MKQPNSFTRNSRTAEEKQNGKLWKTWKADFYRWIVFSARSSYCFYLFTNESLFFQRNFGFSLTKNASRVVRKQKKGKQMWFSHSLWQILTQEKEKRFRVNWKVNLKGWKASGTVCISDDNLILASTFQLWLPNIAYHFDIEKADPEGKENTCRIHENQREDCSAYMEIVISDGRTSPFLKVEHRERERDLVWNSACRRRRCFNQNRFQEIFLLILQLQIPSRMFPIIW